MGQAGLLVYLMFHCVCFCCDVAETRFEKSVQFNVGKFGLRLKGEVDLRAAGIQQHRNLQWLEFGLTSAD
jgi:hypothetical protein